MANVTFKHDIFCFVKGSDDYPINFPINDKFGKATSSSPIGLFNNTIKDVINKTSDPLIIDNNYQLGNIMNVIDDESEVNENATEKKLLEDFVVNEKITSFIVDCHEPTDGSSPRMFQTGTNTSVIYPGDGDGYKDYKTWAKKYINPNYDYISDRPGFDLDYNDGTDPNYNLDYTYNTDPNTFSNSIMLKLFWEKVFLLAEYLYEYQDRITNGYFPQQVYDPSKPSELKSGIYSDNFKINIENSENIPSWAGKYIRLFSSFAEIGPTSDNGGVIVNPLKYRADNVVIGTDPINVDEDNKKFWGSGDWINLQDEGKLVNPNGFVTKLANGRVDIDYSGINHSISLSYSDRLNYVDIAFTIEQKTHGSSSDNYVETHNVRLYFVPDEFIYREGLKQYDVYTFNDENPEGSGDISLPNYNIYDNDYANTLGLRSGGTDKTKDFDITINEFGTGVINKIFEIMKEGTYDGYETINIRRVSPILAENNIDVIWDNTKNVISQTFYIFHQLGGGGETTGKIAQSIKEQYVRDYLQNVLHSTCGRTKFSPDPASGTDKHTILSIGHDYEVNPPKDVISNDELEAYKLSFLSKMYPDLFQTPELYIIPPSKECLKAFKTNPTVTITDETKPGDFMHPITRFMLEEMVIAQLDYSPTVNSIKVFQNYSLQHDQYDTSSGQNRTPAEIFYLAATINDSEGNTMDFPLMALGTNIISNPPYAPLTSISGFENYSVRALLNHSSTDTINAPVEIFQYILAELYRMNFNNVEVKKTEILGVPISYFKATDSKSELATFVLQGNRFNVCSIPNKNFGKDA